MTVELQKGELLKIDSILTRFRDQKVSTRFAYAIVKNQNKMRDELESLREVLKRLAEFETKRLELCRLYADKDEKGEPVLDDNTYKGVAESVDFQEAMSKLQLEYKPTIEEVQKILDEQTEIEFLQVDINQIPDQITPKEIKVLMPLIKDPQGVGKTNTQ